MLCAYPSIALPLPFFPNGYMALFFSFLFRRSPRLLFGAADNMGASFLLSSSPPFLWWQFTAALQRQIFSLFPFRNK